MMKLIGMVIFLYFPTLDAFLNQLFSMFRKSKRKEKWQEISRQNIYKQQEVCKIKNMGLIKERQT